MTDRGDNRVYMRTRKGFSELIEILPRSIHWRDEDTDIAKAKMHYVVQSFTEFIDR
jgi:hypothetical protein